MDEARTQIGFDHTGIGGVLKQERLEVPPNQREYAWTDVEVRQLFQDLAKAIGAGKDHFLGTLVTIPRRNGVLEVVDGQQRLATTAIFLAAIRDYLSEKNEGVIVESINNEFLTRIDRDKRTRVANLKLNVDDNDIFNTIIAGSQQDLMPEVTRSSHRLLVSAHKRALRQVRAIVSVADEKDHGDFLNQWVSFIEHDALVVLLRVPDDADAYRMFETLNDRGLRTSQVDLIKNYMFGQSGERSGEVQSRWAYMRGALDSLDDDDITINFLRHALIVLRGHVTANEVYETVQDIAKSQQGAVTLAGLLERLAATYVATFTSENERWNAYPEAARRAVDVLNLFNIRPMRPLMLSIAAKQKPSEATESLQFLISLSVRLLIASTTRSASVEIPLAAAAKSMFNESISTTNELKEALASITPGDQEFRQAFEITRVSTARLARYYLRSLEEAAKGVPDPWFVPRNDPQVINLEHVLPRKPEGNWPTFDDEGVRLNTTRLGNLALLLASQNSDLKSLPFSEKRSVYRKSPYVLTSQIADADEWSSDAIAARQKGMAEIALKTWRV